MLILGAGHKVIHPPMSKLMWVNDLLTLVSYNINAYMQHYIVSLISIITLITVKIIKVVKFIKTEIVKVNCQDDILFINQFLN